MSTPYPSERAIYLDVILAADEDDTAREHVKGHFGRNRRNRSYPDLVAVEVFSMAEITRKRVGELQRGVFKVLLADPDGLPARWGST